MNILVTGLPRSGTAFVSMLLNLHPDCVAHHELAAYEKNWREYLTSLVFEVDFIADCNTYGYLQQYDFHSDKKIYIVHTPTESHTSAEVATRKKIDPHLMINLARIGEQWAVFNECLVIDRKKVFTLEGCMEIWAYLFDDPMPTKKVEQLIKLNIQQHNAHVHFGENSKFEL